MKKRSVKNSVMVLVILLICTFMFLTMRYAKDKENNVSTTNAPTIVMGGQTPPDMQNEENGEMSENTEDENLENSTESKSNEGMSTPPEKSNNEDNNAPDGGNINQGKQMSDMQSMNVSNSLSIIYYILFGLESMILAIVVMYLVMSKFNQRTFKETFYNGDKVIIFVLASIILMASVTCLDSYVTHRYVFGQSTNQMSEMETSVTYSAVKEITEDETITNGEFSSTNSNENAILVSGDVDVTLSNIKVTKTGNGDSGDTTNFYGNNSGIIAKDGANLILKNITVSTEADGANGVFSYGGSATTNNASNDGTTITISDSTITTAGDNAGGIMTTGGGIMNASNLTIHTSGISSAAIRTDRGGGTVTIDGGTYTTTGQGSPAIYSTADVTVNHAKLVSKASEGIVIEGANSVTINNCDLTDSNTKLNGQSTTYKNIFLYQSMSGDAAEGNASFIANDSVITTNNGDTFYITNTTAAISLTNNTIVNNDKNGYLLRAQADSWGNTGANGGNVNLVLVNQQAVGDIAIDSISQLNMTISSGSYYEGTINGDNVAQSISLTLDKSSKIKLTGDCYVTSFSDEDSTYSNIDFNGYKLYVNNKAIN